MYSNEWTLYSYERAFHFDENELLSNEWVYSNERIYYTIMNDYYTLMNDYHTLMNWLLYSNELTIIFL